MHKHVGYDLKHYCQLYRLKTLSLQQSVVSTALHVHSWYRCHHYALEFCRQINLISTFDNEKQLLANSNTDKMTEINQHEFQGLRHIGYLYLCTVYVYIGNHRCALVMLAIWLALETGSIVSFLFISFRISTCIYFFHVTSHLCDEIVVSSSYLLLCFRYLYSWLYEQSPFRHCKQTSLWRVSSALTKCGLRQASYLPVSSSAQHRFKWQAFSRQRVRVVFAFPLRFVRCRQIS